MTPHTPPPRALRTHQRQVAGIARAIADGAASDVADVLAAVTPGGGKSLLPVIMAGRLVEAGVVERVCWVVPRDSLRLQAEEAFADPAWRSGLGHALAVRAAGNAPDPCRGLAGYVTTYQGVAAAPDLHLAEFRRRRYLLVVDEVHHLPSLAEFEPAAGDAAANGVAAAPAAAGEEEAFGWSRALLPLLECARVRLLLSGTLERADGRPILWLPYRPGGARAGKREVDLHAPGWAVVGYSRAQALAERAVLPVTFGAMDGEAEWLEGKARTPVGPHRLAGAFPTETTRPALFTCLRTGFAEALLREAFAATRRLRAERRAARGLPADAAARGLGKLLVIAPDQANARRYLGWLRAWLPAAQAPRAACIATAAEGGDAHEALAAFRLRPEPSVLVTVAMAYEGLDAPETAVVAALTHIRSRPWLEQMVARATRVDPHAGPYDRQRAVVFHPDDPLFRLFRRRMETEQGAGARAPPPAPRRQAALPFWEAGAADGDPVGTAGIVPVASNALALRYEALAPGPDLAERRPERREAAQAELLEPPSLAERRLRRRIGELVAAQVVEDQATRWPDDDASPRAPRGAGAYHAYNAALKRVLGGRRRAEMTLAELEAAEAWLGRNSLADHLHLLEGDARYGWAARQRRRGQRSAGEGWAPPVGQRARVLQARRAVDR
jgi:superfamily II DNA or RNA helicase